MGSLGRVEAKRCDVDDFDGQKTLDNNIDGPFIARVGVPDNRLKMLASSLTENRTKEDTRENQAIEIELNPKAKTSGFKRP